MVMGLVAVRPVALQLGAMLLCWMPWWLDLR
jgi:hypothetical protein